MPEIITPFEPVSRSSERAGLSDGRAVFQCYAPHAPKYFKRGGLFLPINVGSRVTNADNTVTYPDGVFAVTVDPITHAVTYAPDDGLDERLTMALQSVEVNGKALSIPTASVLSGKIESALDSMLLRGGGLRHVFPVPSNCRSFRVIYRITSEGLTPSWDEGGPFSWFNEGGQFRLKLKPARFITDLERNDSIYDGVIHTLTPDGDGWIYTKESTEAFDRRLLPHTAWLDADTYYGSTGDGNVEAYHASSWSTCRGLSSGIVTSGVSYDNEGISATKWEGAYSIGRSFIPFDTSAIPSSYAVTAAVLYVRGYSYGGDKIYAQKWDGPATVSSTSYNDFSGSAYGYKTPWSSSNWNSITFNSTGCADVAKGTGAVTQICLRHSKDYDNIAPTAWEVQGMYYSEHATYKPYLSITAGLSNVLPPKTYHYMHH